METNEEYIEKNREAWNRRVPVHLESEFYALQDFREGATSLHKIELDLLGNIEGKTILHLQCHFGQDSISLARMGASVTGADLSDAAVATATKLAGELHADARFICCDLYSLPQHLDATFDMVFTTYGTIGWLPDLDKWAALIARYLRPGGKFVFAEFHPVVWMYDNDFRDVLYSYFNTGIIRETSTGSYADPEAAIETETLSWNHSLDEVITALLHAGLQLTGFREYDYSPYNCFNGMEKSGEKQFHISRFGNKIPLVYSITAIRP